MLEFDKCNTNRPMQSTQTFGNPTLQSTYLLELKKSLLK